MSGYYPPGDMTGSGINDWDGTLEDLYCGECDRIIDTAVDVSGRGRLIRYTCPVCGTEQEATWEGHAE